jgi:RNA polymerase sigma-70 factor (ECF subfamily)
LNNDPTILEDLVVQARNGDLNARASLYRLFVKAMYNNCIRITGNKTDAEDVLHESFLYAFQHLREINHPASFGGWLRRIVISNAIRYCRKNLNWEDLHEEYERSEPGDESPWWINIPLELVHLAIKQLPAGCRQVFILYVFENFAHKEIAASLGISESTSKSQYQRARKLLKERLANQIEKYG